MNICENIYYAELKYYSYVYSNNNNLIDMYRAFNKYYTTYSCIIGRFIEHTKVYI